MNKTAAIFYRREDYDTSINNLYGRHIASAGFLKGLVEYGTAEHLYCYTGEQQTFSEFCDRIQPWVKYPQKVRWLTPENINGLAQAGTIYKGDPVFASLLWQRRFTNQRYYSICGINHTISPHTLLKDIGDLIIAPSQAWDALICTSVAAKNVMKNVLDNWAEYLAERMGGKPQINFQLPVIPLGIDCDIFDQGIKSNNIRSQIQKELGISPEDVVILYVGRLNFYAKAHPVPMYLALEQAVQATGAKVHLIQAGWFKNQTDEMVFKAAAKVFCPSANHIFIDGRKPEIRTSIWSGVDIFISLSDNIQETFGITPIEAMSAGLPVIVSDWDGYQDSVRDGIDGFRIPTIIPPPEAGFDFAFSYFNDTWQYGNYVGYTSMSTAVDVDACAQALATLISNQELRQRLGENGRKRAREIYDWQVIIASYEALWEELAELRARADLSVPLTGEKPAYPFCDTPYRTFANYSTQTLRTEMVLGLGTMAKPANVEKIRKIWISNWGDDRRTSEVIIDEIIVAIAKNGSLTVGAILNLLTDKNPIAIARLQRTLVYLLKFDILRIQH